MALKPCPECGKEVSSSASSCPHCGQPLVGGHAAPPAAAKSDTVAGCLGLALGPVGLWYKGRWVEGFAWLVMGIILSLATGGIAAPFLWVGMAVHAAKASPK